MIISKEYNNVTFMTHYINKIENNKYKDDFLDHIMHIYKTFLIIKLVSKRVILKESNKL